MTRKRWFALFALLVLFALALAACGGSTESAATQAPAQQEEAAPKAEEPKEEATEEAPEAGGEEDLVKKGEELFNQNPLGANAGCVTCHSIEPGVQLVGPSLAGIATTAAERVPGMSAEEYIRQSIVDPNAYIVEGFPEGLMPSYSDLPPEQIDALVAYLMTLK
ncbi:MAG: cytochrome c [Chloroflexi bacterium]|nr:cytochrome c [Chloroflexota bacterium]